MKIDLNADLGEGFGPYFLTEDDALLGIVSSANIACGMHAGDPSTMARVCRMAGDRGVAIGAHPGYSDRDGFGRRVIPLSATEIEVLVAVQIGALQAAAALSGNRVRYVKPHGALYTLAEKNGPAADAICRATHACDPSLAVMTSPGSLLLRAADDFGLAAVVEGFADRRYEPDGFLVSRNKDSAIIENIDDIADQAFRLATGQGVVTIDGTIVPMAVQTICLHGDSRSAVETAKAVRQRLRVEGVLISPFLKGVS
ncbi:LamB/YcsF family protein [Brucella cytisi]|uniref:LamB/YcsF family protein n=1 Tax=Brucella cytisi TaxID=407152 RepID=UPI0035DD0A00